MKQPYTEPVLEVEILETQDVIRTSETELPPEELTWG